METPTLRDIEWASVLYTLTSGYDKDYVTYMRKLDGYRPFDEKKQEGDFKPGDVIIEFLHKWHTQGVPSKISGKLTEKIKKNADRIDSLLEVPLHEVSESDIKDLYNQFINIKGFGPTATAKTLHLLCPETFIMWDGEIIKDFKDYLEKHRKKYAKGTQIYVEFMREESERFLTVLSDNSVSALNELLEKLSKYEGTEFYKKTKAKIIDEYNWLTITRDVKIPFQMRISECVKL